MAVMGRPSYELSDDHWNILDVLAGIPKTVLTQQDILCALRSLKGLEKLSFSTLCRLIRKKHGCTFDDFREQKSGAFKSKILAKQMAVAMKGNPAMLIWLDKRYIMEKEDGEVSGSLSTPQGDIVFKAKFGGAPNADPNP